MNYCRCALAALAFVVLTGCDEKPDEEQINQAIDEISQHIEDKKFSGIADYFHNDFRANNSMDLHQLKQLLKMYGLQHQSIGITIINRKTTLDPIYSYKAETLLSVVTTGGSRGHLPNDGSVRSVTIEWRKDNHWKIIASHWK